MLVTGARKQADHVAETTIWSYVIQITAALRVMHSKGLSAHGISPSKVIVMDKSRLRINCAGILDVITFDGSDASLMGNNNRLQVRVFTEFRLS